MRGALGGPRVLLRRLREVMAEPVSAQERLDKIVVLIAANMVAEVCSVYVLRVDSTLELYATEGLKRDAVHQTVLRSDEGLVGLVSSQATAINLSNAQAHPAFSFRPETGEEIYHSFLGVPILRAGNTLGVLVVQNRARRTYSEEEVEALQTTAMVLAEMIASGELSALALPGAEPAARRTVHIKGSALSDGIALGHVVLHEPRVVVTNFIADDIPKELKHLQAAVETLRANLDELLEHGDVVEGGEHRDILEAYRMFAYDRGWIHKLEEAVMTGLTEEGGPHSHVAIVARALGIPAVGEIDNATGVVDPGDAIIVDGSAGDLHVRPLPDMEAAYAERVRLGARRQQQYLALRDKPCVTKDGQEFTLLLNAGLTVDLPHIADTGAAGIGLFRTELQFMVAPNFPRTSEQYTLYRAVLDAAGDKPVTFRTLDIGGDKVLPYMRNVEEENPALGWRAIRLGLERPALLRTQLRALLRAAGSRSVKIMFPMIATVTEFDQAKELVERELTHLRRHGHKLPDEVEVGSMVEVPSLLYQLDELLEHVDFLSVGSNDLVQFLYAVDRGNPRVANRFDPLSAPGFRALKDIADKCHEHKKPVTLCGELASQPIGALALAAIGYRALSLTPSAVGPVKALLLDLDCRKAAAFLQPVIDKQNGGVPIREQLKQFAAREALQI